MYIALGGEIIQMLKIYIIYAYIFIFDNSNLSVSVLLHRYIVSLGMTMEDKNGNTAATTLYNMWYV